METGKANNIKASTFNIDHSEKYHLSVEIGLKHLSYCIINNNTNNVEYFNNFSINDNVIRLINNEDFLKLNFASSSVSFTNFPYTLVPNEFFEEEKLKEILELNINIYDVIKTDELAEIKTHLVYTISNEINEIVFTFFPNAKQISQQSILIDTFSKLDNKKNNTYLYISEKILNITIFKNEKLVFNNSFSFKTKEDILYFTLFTFEQLKIDSEIVNVKLYGDIIKGDENYQLLYDYIRNIEFGTRPKHIKFSKVFNKIQEHQFHALFSQSI
jgi:hypothetical protein